MQSAPRPRSPRFGRRRRRLFLDDDPTRAAAFLARHPDAVWVETVADCLERLAEPWAEVHLDHDLGGEVYVDTARADCGMEVVRWLLAGPRPHLGRARFFVHSHNMMAALEMVVRLRQAGYRVSAAPFGLPSADSPPRWKDAWHRAQAASSRFGPAARAWLARLRRRPEPRDAPGADPGRADDPDASA